MFNPDQYQLLDFGQGRRLERFAAWILDRPCPTAENISKSNPHAWRGANAHFIRDENDEDRWVVNSSIEHSVGEISQNWTISHDCFKLELKLSPAGHLGVFPEQAENWDWISGRIKSAGRTLKLLNLFAYTGGSTLAAAAAGAEVTHVDAARNTVAWARRNAELSGMADASIRWIADDALKFVRRELKRGIAYDAVILDPPSYGHGARGEVWRLAKHLPKLLSLCAELLQGRGSFMLLTCHTPGFGPERLRDMLAEALGREAAAGRLSGEQLYIKAAMGKRLSSGASASWQRE